ncbi:Tn3 family transposase [Streptomyces sp. NPDC057424]|uniref:Tn3 family transposase n=1 Tax=Streptomyces sp. NPDC057424 TaxID=3346127 RepID=UPI00368BE314
MRPSRKIARQLNKGESLHALRRQLHYAREGKVTRRQSEQQNEQAWCLTVATNAVVCWHTEYMGLGVDELRGACREVDAEVLAHISPARSSVVNHYGSITVDYEHELAQLDDQGHWPLRTVTTDEPGAGMQNLPRTSGRKDVSSGLARHVFPWQRPRSAATPLLFRRGLLGQRQRPLDGLPTSRDCSERRAAQTR